ncbi:MAG: ArsC family transcriptional regulator [Oscillospiraceae bacterium]|jgi:arsenate reductase-like glutaredoxin family protein|nr:ArsC family transcriptional regulator [Oscillospiraceae bacterium]
MGIQVFGKSKCFDTGKTERWFKERRIKYQYIDLKKYGMSRGEFDSVKASVGLENMINDDAPGAEQIRYLAYDADKADKLFEHQELMKTPVVRSGRKAVTGFHPEIWKDWD